MSHQENNLNIHRIYRLNVRFMALANFCKRAIFARLHRPRNKTVVEGKKSNWPRMYRRNQLCLNQRMYIIIYTLYEEI